MKTAKIDQIERTRLGFLPTPLVELPRLRAALAKRTGSQVARILMKRDDQTGLATGGNKTRKLEYLLGAALAEGCDTLITGGAAQSNHCRQTAAAAAMCGLECHLALHGDAPDLPGGNVLLDLLFGARIHWCGEDRKGEHIPAIAGDLRRAGKKPYLIPYGGSNATGALGFVQAAREVAAQLKEREAEGAALVFASSSGGTQAGLVVGRRLFRGIGEAIGIAIDKGGAGEPPFGERVLALSREVAARLDPSLDIKKDDIVLRDAYLGGGYGVVGDLERDAISLLAGTEGILLDPVYTGRAFGALLDLIAKGEFAGSETVLFWHTGGTPALFPYARDILRARA